MGDISMTANTPQAAVAASNKWKDYLQAKQQQQQAGGLTFNVPTIDGYGGGQVQIGGPTSTLGQVPITQRRLGGISNAGLYGDSLNVLS